MLSFQSSKIEPISSIEKALKKAILNVDCSFGYPNPSGNELLIKEINKLHPHWEGKTLITNSATEATYLALSLFEGKTIALNVPSYFGVIRQIKEFGLNVIEWENTEDLLNIPKCDVILLTSNFTPPTGKSFSLKEKEIIAKYAKENDAVIIEDNAYEFLSYGKEKITSIPSEKFIRINSFSKLLSPSLRMGFSISSEDLYLKMRSKKITMNLSSSEMSQSIIYSVIKDHSIISEWQDELKERAYICKDMIDKYFNIDVSVYDGGAFIKLPIKSSIKISQVIDKCKENGVLLDDNKNQYLDSESKNYIRLHLGAINKHNIECGIKLIKSCVDNLY